MTDERSKDHVSREYFVWIWWIIFNDLGATEELNDILRHYNRITVSDIIFLYALLVFKIIFQR